MASDIKRQTRTRGKMKKYNPTGLRLTVFRSLTLTPHHELASIKQI